MSYCMETWTPSGYVDAAIRDFKKKSIRSKFDMVVCQGLSGLAVAFILERELGIPILIQRRKTSEGQKRGAILEGQHLLYRFYQKNKKQPNIVFIDDCSGTATFRRVSEGLAQHGAVITHEYYYGNGVLTSADGHFNLYTTDYRKRANETFKAIMGRIQRGERIFV